MIVIKFLSESDFDCKCIVFRNVIELRGGP